MFGLGTASLYWLCYIIFNLYRNNLTFDVGLWSHPKRHKNAKIHTCLTGLYQLAMWSRVPLNCKYKTYSVYSNDLQCLVVRTPTLCSTTGTWIQWLAINTNMAKELRCPTPFSSQCLGYGLQICWFCQIIFNLCENNLTFESGLTLACPGEENRYFLFPQDLPEKNDVSFMIFRQMLEDVGWKFEWNQIKRSNI